MEGEQEPETMGATTLGRTTFLPTSSQQYQPVLSDDLPSESSVPRDVNAPGTYANKASLTWRPFYLQRAVLLGFIFVFILLIVTIELLLAMSNRNSGIATGRSTEHYLWTYGPTAFLTVVAAVWARTEYQSKLVAPWIHLAQNHQSKHAIPASRTLLLDYISQFSIFSLVSSLRIPVCASKLA
ncbi:hypothetical protein ANO14919_007060 [Xylariales sp. No.14919]|nr:hypothetical protein ANO14919_007060 [Xylariales sp. No.14919]